MKMGSKPVEYPVALLEQHALTVQPKVRDWDAFKELVGPLLHDRSKLHSVVEMAMKLADERARQETTRQNVMAEASRHRIQQTGGSGVDGEVQESSQKKRKTRGCQELTNRDAFRKLKDGEARLNFLIEKEKELHEIADGNKELLTDACKRWYNRHVLAVLKCLTTCFSEDKSKFLAQYGHKFKTNGFQCTCSVEKGTI